MKGSVPFLQMIWSTWPTKKSGKMYCTTYTVLSPYHCKIAPESWGIGGPKVVSSKGLEGYEMFDPKDSRREDREEENA